MSVGPLDPPQACLDVGKKHGRVVRLGHKVVGTQRHGHNLVKVGSATGDHDDGHMRDAAKLTTDYLPVGARQAQIEQHEIGRSGENVVYKAVKTGGTCHLVSRTLQKHRKLLAHRLVVFNYIYMHICITCLIHALPRNLAHDSKRETRKPYTRVTNQGCPGMYGSLHIKNQPIRRNGRCFTRMALQPGNPHSTAQPHTEAGRRLCVDSPLELGQPT